MSKSKSIAFLIVGLVASFVAGTWYSQRDIHAATTTSTAPGRKILYYVDPMHPAYKSDKPGIAPDCGMQLEPVYADGGSVTNSPNSLLQAPAGSFQITPERQQMIGVRLGDVENTSGNRTLRTLGRVVVDETRVFRVAALVDGLVRSAGPVVTGDIVSKDQLLGTFYNRDFLTAQQTYMYALGTMDRFKANENEEQLKLTKAQIQAAEENLEFLGMGPTQLQEIALTRKIARNIELRSPVEGVVLARNVFSGLRFERGTELFRVAQLDRVWILADVFENEAQYFRPGMAAQVTLPRQKKTFPAKVSQALPQFDATSRTLKLRLEVENPGFLLRPDMFVDVQLSTPSPSAITVPSDAIIDSGLRKTVFVARENGFFEPRTIETGWRNGDRVQVVRGLAPGEHIVVSGTFLLDSESRLRAAADRAKDSLTRDPVCGMEVDPGKAQAAGHVREHAGKNHYFCTDQCARDFDKNPDRYLKPETLSRATAAQPKPEKPAERKSVASVTKVIDKVCGMEIDMARTEHLSQHAGQTLYFCSESCKKTFDRDPDKYFSQRPLTKEDRRLGVTNR